MQEKNQAYDLELFSTQEFAALRVEENKSAAAAKRRRALKLVETVVLCALVLALVVSVVYSRARLTVLSDQATSLDAQLVAERSVYEQLSYRLESDATLSKIEAYVTGQLGMVKTDKSQVTYIALSEENCTVAADSGIGRYWETLQDKVSGWLAYLGG